MSDFANALEIGAYAIATILTCCAIAAGLWALTHDKPRDNYQSPTIRDNVRRVK